MIHSLAASLIAANRNRGVEMLRITDKGFHYTPSFNTDLKKRFAKMIREQRAAAAQAAAKPVPPASNSVVPIIARRQG